MAAGRQAHWGRDDGVTGKTRTLAAALGLARPAGFLPAALGIAALFAALLVAEPSAASQAGAQGPAPPDPGAQSPWARVPVMPGGPVDTRPTPPKEGRSRCIGVNGIAGAQMFGDSAVELTMRNGARYRLFLAKECTALSFYQGFYYRRQKAGQLCAGRDVIGARSGGECPIASILPVTKIKRPPGR